MSKRNVTNGKTKEGALWVFILDHFHWFPFLYFLTLTGLMSTHQQVKHVIVWPCHFQSTKNAAHLEATETNYSFGSDEDHMVSGFECNLCKATFILSFHFYYTESPTKCLLYFAPSLYKCSQPGSNTLFELPCLIVAAGKKVLRDIGPNGDKAIELMLLDDVNSYYVPTQYMPLSWLAVTLLALANNSERTYEKSCLCFIFQSQFKLGWNY